ncbi:hypothetical protein DH2020_021506 [Rehmannia glutinosa]|uniref:Uncharacterized protein n=1 Tax=Rehmannia glutinosa TaxID=99300 RepID=A0ABR0WD34_REHGL
MQESKNEVSNRTEVTGGGRGRRRQVEFRQVAVGESKRHNANKNGTSPKSPTGHASAAAPISSLRNVNPKPNGVSKAKAMRLTCRQKIRNKPAEEIDYGAGNTEFRLSEGGVFGVLAPLMDNAYIYGPKVTTVLSRQMYHRSEDVLNGDFTFGNSYGPVNDDNQLPLPPYGARWAQRYSFKQTARHSVRIIRDILDRMTPNQGLAVESLRLCAEEANEDDHDSLVSFRNQALEITEDLMRLYRRQQSAVHSSEQQLVPHTGNGESSPTTSSSRSNLNLNYNTYDIDMTRHQSNGTHVVKGG